MVTYRVSFMYYNYEELGILNIFLIMIHTLIRKKSNLHGMQHEHVNVMESQYIM